MNIVLVIVCAGFFSCCCRSGVRPAKPADQRLLPGGCDARRTNFFFEWGAPLSASGWLYNYNASGAIEVRDGEMLRDCDHRAGGHINDALLVVLAIVIVMTWLASNLIRGRYGRAWMMVRDMDIAAELMGDANVRAKSSSPLPVSSFYCGVAGAMMVFLWYGSAGTIGSPASEYRFRCCSW